MNIAQINNDIAHLMKIETTRHISMATNEKYYRVKTDFIHRDGDNLTIFLKPKNDKWILSDGGSTFFRIKMLHHNPNIDTQIKTTKLYIKDVYWRFEIEEDNTGELIQYIDDDDDRFASRIFDFTQALLYIIRTFEIYLNHPMEKPPKELKLT